MHKLAFLTIGLLHEPIGKPRVQGFVDRIPGVYVEADRSDGFQARSIRDVDTWKHSWGEVVPPNCYREHYDELRFAMTLSLWKDLESVAAFAYHGPHAEALTKRREWFVGSDLPVYVAWWVGAEDAVDWAQASERLDHLHANGSAAFAFNFARPFDAAGSPFRLDRAEIKRKAAMNASTARPHGAEVPAASL